jgi:hypothetical protein
LAEETEMRTFAIATIIALLAAPAYAAKRDHKPNAQATEDPQKKKAQDKAYNDALKRIPDQPINKDTWGNVR